MKTIGFPITGTRGERTSSLPSGAKKHRCNPGEMRVIETARPTNYVGVAQLVRAGDLFTLIIL